MSLFDCVCSGLLFTLCIIMLVASYEQRAFSLDERKGGEAGAASCMFCDDVLFRYIR